MICLWAEIQRQNERRCEKEIEDIKREIRPGNVAADVSRIRYSDEALDEQKHSIRIADEKVALAVQAYDLVRFQYIKVQASFRFSKAHDIKQGFFFSTIENDIQNDV